MVALVVALEFEAFPFNDPSASICKKPGSKEKCKIL
ncbi:hypothetical protein BGP_6377 [Beggiatoa sp. PS]|nr:hypothetical protein BGP_6377 [Beggiatoa sp. PS]